MVFPTSACILSLILRGALPRSVSSNASNLIEIRLRLCSCCLDRQTIHDFPMHCLSKVSLLVLLQMLMA
jgi:hypothetical protein